MGAPLNQELFHAINQFAGKNLFSDVLALGLAKYTPYIFIGVLLLLWFTSTDEKRIVLYAGYSAVLGLSLNFLTGLFYFHPRPFAEGIGQTILSHAPDNSFPSDHTTFLLAISIEMMFFPKTRALGIFLLFFSVLGGLSRVFVGVHYPFDIIGSLITALLAATLIYIFKNKFIPLNKVFFKVHNVLFKNQ